MYAYQTREVQRFVPRWWGGRGKKKREERRGKTKKGRSPSTLAVDQIHKGENRVSLQFQWTVLYNFSPISFFTFNS